MITFRYCPQCGGKLIKAKLDGAPHCQHCQRPYYNNVGACACIMAVKAGKVLIARRAINPYQGALDVVGGFMQPGEDPARAALREFKEETGLEAKITDLLGIYPDQYGQGGDYTIAIVYVGKVTGGIEQAQDDVAALEWMAIEKLPVKSGGFASTDRAFADLKKRYKR